MEEQTKTMNSVVDKRIDDLIHDVNHAILFVEAKHGSFIALCLVLIAVIFEHFIGKHSCPFINALITATTITLLVSMLISIRAIYPRKRKRRKGRKETLSILEKSWQKIKKFLYGKKETENEETGNEETENKEKHKIHYLFRCEEIELSSSGEIMNIVSEGIEGYRFSEFEKHKINKIMGVAKSTSRKYRLFRRAICCFGFFIIEFITLIILKQL